MKKFVADTLEEAYKIAAETLGCSVSELKVEVVQYPTKGIMGLFAKEAIIVAACPDLPKAAVIQEDVADVAPETDAGSVASEAEETDVQTATEEEMEEESDATLAQDDPSVEGFFEEEPVPLSDEEIAREIETDLKALIETSCFDIDIVEVDVRDSTALIFLDGNDAALLIGKEGYRYNALSYILYNWIHAKYGLYVKLEIAQFLTMQQEMIRNYLVPVIEEIRANGRGRTKVLDGILVQIALEELRATFPDKYVAIKTDRYNGGKYVIVNAFNRR